MEHSLHVRLGAQLARLELVRANSSPESDLPTLRFFDLRFSLVRNLSADDAAPPSAQEIDASLPGAHLMPFRDAFATLTGAEGKPHEVKRFFIRFLFARHKGYITRCDFLERRLEGSVILFPGSIKSFVSPLAAAIEAPDEICLNQLPKILPTAVGAIVLPRPRDQSEDSFLAGLNHELRRRLSFPWLLREPIVRRRVFWIQGREDLGSIRRAYEAALALGINLVILDHPGHWLQDDGGPHSRLREAFIPTNIDADLGLPQRIVDAVKAYPCPVHGIVTISDILLPAVARACEVLGLPTSPSTAYQTAGDKAATRRLEEENDDGDGDGDDSYFVLSDPSQLDDMLEQRRDQIDYPLIVKPTTGWNSECVTKVTDEAELQAAVRRASARHASGPTRSKAVLVEPYVGGPEVNANFVLLQGRLLFYDISDDFPSTGDIESSGPQSRANFQETLIFIPSALPAADKALVRDSLQERIRRQGFTSGVFHCEARVCGSRACYAARRDNGLLDLETRDYGPWVEESSLRPSCYLHEINARPPAYLNTVAVLLAYGVDYYALRLLFSLGACEEGRIRALSQPFLEGPQYSLSIVILPAARSGIMETEDAVADLVERHPWLQDYIVDARTCKRRGDIVQGPESSELSWVAYVTVASRRGRRDCLEKAAFVKKHFRFRLVGEDTV